jgi:hypothetical protein
MAERHERLVKKFRSSPRWRAFRETKSPMPDFRPDFFGQVVSSAGKVTAQVAVEAEIESTLFKEHTSYQLTIMNDYIAVQKNRGIRVHGFLLVPSGKGTQRMAERLLKSLFPRGTSIEVAQRSA